MWGVRGGGKEEAGPPDRELRLPAALSISKQEGLTETVRSLVSAEKAATRREAVSPHGGQLFSQKVAYESPFFGDTVRTEGTFTIARF